MFLQEVRKRAYVCDGNSDVGVPTILLLLHENVHRIHDTMIFYELTLVESISSLL
jgi:hypothetical protein